MNLYRIRYIKVTDNSTTVKLKYDIDGINKFSSNWVDCGFKIFAIIDEEDLN